MRKRTYLLIIAGLILFISGKVFAQNSYKIHSHNDYAQELPFWFAYSSGASSIEADVFLKDDELYVTHAENEIVEGNTLKSLYLDGLRNLEASGKLRELQLLIDMKSEAYATLKKLVDVLKEYPELISDGKVKFVISGNRPKPEEYKNYPDFIWFDHQNLEELGTIDLDKVALVSTSYKNYSVWNGYGRMTGPDLAKVETAINKA
ncbi:MAG: alkaline phosphatase, partial [Flavobacteriaceae bacterium]|nr:alkaline phosphatase [Flavobacteriaceae bacterium]